MMLSKDSHPWYIYILECENGSYYTGITRDMTRRFLEHRRGTSGSKFTRSFRPVRIAGCWVVDDSRGAAQRMELLIKSMDRAAKDSLIINPESLVALARARGIDAIPRPATVSSEARSSDTDRHDITGYVTSKRDASIQNPYLEEALALVREARGMARDELELFLARRRPDLVSRYAFSIPTLDVLEPVAALSPLVEIGAGTGYWAMCLSGAGADIIAYDRRPPGDEPPGAWDEANQWFDDIWFPVSEGDETMAGRLADRTLFLCWPPLYDPMAAGALRRYRDAGGKTLVFIGCPGGCGDDEFYAELASIKPELSMDLWSWPGIKEKMIIYHFA